VISEVRVFGRVHGAKAVRLSITPLE
jgi:hypothetical protein